MAHFESDADVYAQLGGILSNLVYNAARREQLRQADAVVQFAFREPQATVTFDVREGKRARIDLGDTKLRPDVVLAMDADVGHALLTGELHPTIALARGDVRTKGSVNKVLRVIPVTVGAHEVEADLEPEPEPVEPEAAAEAVPEAPVEPVADAEPEPGPVDPPAEAEAPPAEAEAPEAPAEAEAPPAEAEAPGEPEPVAEPVEPEAAAEAVPEAPAELVADAEPEPGPVDPPVEAEAPPAEPEAPGEPDPPAEAEAPEQSG